MAILMQPSLNSGLLQITPATIQWLICLNNLFHSPGLCQPNKPDGPISEMEALNSQDPLLPIKNGKQNGQQR